jgi:hypothetical protein
MYRRGLLVVSLLFAAPLAAYAQGTERYLPSGSQIVLQVDSHLKTKAAYDRTVAGQMMAGDTGKFLRAFYKWLIESGETAANEYLIPSKEDVALIKDGLGLIEKLSSEGMALGIEIKQPFPPDGRVVVVLPKLGAGQPNLIRLLNDLRAKVQNVNAPAEIKEERIAGRTVYHVGVPMVSLGWWAQGDDFVMTIGTGPVADYIKMIDDGKTGLANNPTYKKLNDMGAFPTRSRAYVDVPSLVKLADNFSEQAGKTVEALGFKGVGPILSISGYDGPAQRTLTEIETIGPRKGLASFSHSKTISMADLPPLPSDLTSFSAANANAGKMYATLLDLVENVGKIYIPDQVDTIKAAIKTAEDLIGVDLRKDLFANFDDLTIQYVSPSEDAFGIAGTSLFKVKDEAKLRKAINSLIGAIPKIPGVEMGMKKRTFRGVEVLEFHAHTPGNYAVMSIAVHKGYLAFANYPQPIHGFILRMNGELPTWKADERVSKAIGAFPKQFTSISVSDPRPGVQGLIAVLPPLITLANGFTGFIPGLQPFDISQIPHAQLATSPLFPNVSIATDDGKTIRIEQRTSVGW